MINFVTKKLSDSAVVVEVSGDLNEMSRGYFFGCVSDMLESGISNVVIECHKLGLVNSSGLAALLFAKKQATKRGCRIYFTHVNSRLAEVLEITKLGRLLSVYPTTERAIRKFLPKAPALARTQA